MHEPTPGEVAYLAYWPALDIAPPVPWNGLSPVVHTAWEVAAEAVLAWKEERDAWRVRCGGCGVIFPAQEEIEEDVCPRCGRHSVLSPRFQGDRYA